MTKKKTDNNNYKNERKIVESKMEIKEKKFTT